MADAVHGIDAPASQTESKADDDRPEVVLTEADLADVLAKLDVVDELHKLDDFLTCALMAANELDPRERDAIQTVVNHVSEGLQELADRVHPRGDPGMETPEAA